MTYSDADYENYIDWETEQIRGELLNVGHDHKEACRWCTKVWEATRDELIDLMAKVQD